MESDRAVQSAIRTIEEYGGLFEADTLHEMEPNVQAFFRVIPKYLREIIAGAYPIDITFVYVQNDSINALAMPYSEDDYLIGIFSDVIHLGDHA